MEAMGVAWKAYNDFTKQNEKKISDEEDFQTLRRMIGAIHAKD